MKKIFKMKTVETEEAFDVITEVSTKDYKKIIGGALLAFHALKEEYGVKFKEVIKQIEEGEIKND